MLFIWTQLKILLVALTFLSCAFIGMIGIMEVIRCFVPDFGPWDGTDQRLPGLRESDEEEEKFD